MKRIVKLTESDLTRIVKRIINEEECSAPPEWLMNFKLDGKKGTSDCSNWNWRVSSNLFVWISLKDKMLSLTTELELDETSKKTISSAMGTQPKTKSTTLYWSKTFMSSEAGGDLNRTLNGLQGQIPWMSSLNESYLTRMIRRVINEDKKEDPMKYFENIGNEIQRSVLRTVKYSVNPIRIRNHSNYFKQVVDNVWYDIDHDENTPSKRDFVKFMKRDFADQILSHHQGLGR